jgi:hypothetical protein
LPADGAAQGAQPACKGTASRGHSPPANAQKEQTSGDNIDRGKGRVNAPSHPYTDHGGRIVWHRQTATKRDGIVIEKIPLANFRARIVADITRDDGVETMRCYEIAATLGERSFRFEVLAARFNSMAWVHEHLGANAIVATGQGMQACLLNAVLELSAGNISERQVFAHTGWREIDGRMYFLHAGGALGTNGNRDDVDVMLPEQLKCVELNQPDDAKSLVQAVRAQLLLQTLAPMRIMAPLLAAAYRAPLGESDITAAPWGRTGHFKTEAAILVQQHFGAGMDARHLPLSWVHDTANTIEHVLSVGKDIVTVVDEYVHGETPAGRATMQTKVERVIRAQGNASGRGRMRADTTLRPPRPPRGQLVSTGEEVPAGQSLRARILTAEVRQNDINVERLTRSQEDAAAGKYATAMAGFIIWLANDLEGARRAFQTMRQELRSSVNPSTDARGRYRAARRRVASLAPVLHRYRCDQRGRGGAHGGAGVGRSNRGRNGAGGTAAGERASR